MTCKGKHERPVHFNRGRHGHVWLCVACGKHLAGPELPEDEREALIEFSKLLSEQPPKRAITRSSEMQLVITVKDGATNKDIAAQLRFQAGLIEGLDPKAAASRKNTDADETDDTDEDDDFTEKKTAKGTKGKKSAAASFDEDDGGDDTDGDAGDDADDEDFTEKKSAKSAKAGKTKKITIDMVNDACKAKAADSSRKDVLALLKKHFKTQSVSEIKPEQYAKVIEVMEA